MTIAALGTIATRVAVAAISLLVAAVAARMLGLEALGRMSLLVLAITFIMLLCNVVSGGLVYLEPRHGTRTLRWLAYGWSALACTAGALLVEPLGVAPAGLGVHAGAIAFLESVATTHLSILLGRQRFAMHNSITLIRPALLITAFVLLLRAEGADVHDFIGALYISHGSSALLSGLLLSRLTAQSSDAGAALSAMLRQGIPAQAANGLQLLNYRLSYLLIQRFHGSSALGLWSITTQLAESAWLAPKSLGSVLYARVSNLDAQEEQLRLTLTVMKVSVALALFAAALLAALPDSLFQWVFGPEAHGIGRLVLLLGPGLIAMAASQALSHYFSGVGRVHHNTIASGIALAVTIPLGLWLIPGSAERGAAIVSSAAFTSAIIYQVIVFSRLTASRFPDYLPNRADMVRLQQLWRRLTGR